ncbi:uncharacterized protein EDB93DRAFT_1160086 [Suillus bovinus]|uniref:uncharacterized protein n=1 Tax=Suillus bovinus TaxID=48563 RepID=UPI001B8622FC|nr:uncharacterized protein EDB93DRAFT_1160086 [Suillus bovinus]KAG2141135.1 hypothetical protein EDB93DRAFT_1160086 [Suillus bovinus]
MSTRPHTAAVVANAKIFPVFANRLASHDISEYINTAKKLKNWLGSEKAYYPDALRNIVLLLEIAHQTFTKRFLQTEQSAFAVMDIYQALIRAVIPFLRFFTEEDLQLRLHDLIQSSSQLSNNFVYPVRAEGDTAAQEYKDATSMITTTRDATPSTQLMFPSIAQVESVQSPTTAQISTSSTPDTRPDLPTSTSTPRALPKPQPKRQAVTSSLSEHLKHRDIEWFKSQHQPAAASDSKPSSPAPPGALKFSNDVTEPPAEKIRPSRMPGRIPPQPAFTELTTATEPAAPANGADLTSALPSTEVSAPTVAKEVKQEIPSVVADVVMNDPQTGNVPQGLETVLGTPGNVAPELTTPSPEQDIDSPAPRQPPAISSDVGVKSQGDEILLPPVDHTCPQVTCARFGGEMAVMMFRQGLSPRGTINVTFNLDHTLYLQIARWAKRKSSPTDLEQSVCVSFACYHLPSLLPNPPEDDQPTPFEKLTMNSQCSWPTTGDLSLQTKRDGKDFIIPLAPPIFVTPDNCVDISAFIRSGENAFSMVQQSDMSDYMFVLHAHHPTPVQLGHLASCRQKREDWVKTTLAFCTSEPTESLWRRS